MCPSGRRHGSAPDSPGSHHPPLARPLGHLARAPPGRLAISATRLPARLPMVAGAHRSPHRQGGRAPMVNPCLPGRPMMPSGHPRASMDVLSPATPSPLLRASLPLLAPPPLPSPKPEKHLPKHFESFSGHIFQPVCYPHYIVQPFCLSSTILYMRAHVHYSIYISLLYIL